LFALAFACANAGGVLFAQSAARLWREGERRPGLTLMLVMLAQPIVFFADLHGAAGAELSARGGVAHRRDPRARDHAAALFAAPSRRRSGIAR
jgi:hypothetical protein